MQVRSKSIFKKILKPVIEIVVIFAILSFAVSYYSIDRFVRKNAKDRIEEAYNLVKEKKEISHGLGTQVFIFDDDFEEVLYYDEGITVNKEMTEFIKSLLTNYELDEEVLVTIKRDGKEYLAMMHDAGRDNENGRYFVVLQELTNRVDYVKENFLNVFILQLLVLFIVGIIVYKIQSDNEEEARKQKTIYENVAHDLRTPLVSILGYADGLKSGIIKDKDKACDIILKTGNQLKEMIENILVLSRFDNESYKSSIEDIDVSDLINEQVETLKVIDDRKSIEVVDNLGYDSHYKSDRKLLVRIIQNLLSNAMKYAESKIVITCQKDEKKHLIIEIIDDGEGIDENNISHVFERYYKGTDGHFGIGLAVVKSSVEFLNGKVSVCRNNDKGTKFTVSI